MELQIYNEKIHKSLMQRYISRQKDLQRYANKGIYAIMSFFGIYHSDLYLFCVNTKIVGCILLRKKLSLKHRNADWIYDVLIFPEYRGKGYSKIMMRMAIEKCREKKVLLYVDVDNYVAIRLYEKIGFCGEYCENNQILMRYDKI